MRQVRSLESLTIDRLWKVFQLTGLNIWVEERVGIQRHWFSTKIHLINLRGLATSIAWARLIHFALVTTISGQLTIIINPLAMYVDHMTRLQSYQIALDDQIQWHVVQLTISHSLLARDRLGVGHLDVIVIDVNDPTVAQVPDERQD